MNPIKPNSASRAMLLSTADILRAVAVELESDDEHSRNYAIQKIKRSIYDLDDVRSALVRVGDKK